MCGRYVISQINLEERFEASKGYAGDFRENYNVSPSQIMPTITRNSPNKITLMRWGLIPFWAKDPRIGFKMINARAEGVESKPSFREPFRKRRCLVPDNGFYEWKKDGKEKIPYYIKLKNNETFAFAGLYDIWIDAEGLEVTSYTIITTSPNDLVKDIHDRMPVILNREDEDIWLDPSSSLETLKSFLNPYNPSEMLVYEVSREVNITTNNYSELISEHIEGN